MDVFKHVRSQVREITPEQAEKLIPAFHAKAKVSQYLVEAYARDMAEGHWLLNGTSIVLSQDGKVLDGRARLLACARARRSFETLVVEGIDVGSFETIDSVRKRTLADVLTIRRERHGKALAAGLRVIWSYHNGTIKTARTPSSMALLAQLEAHPEIRDSVMPSLKTAPLLPHGTGIALHHLFGLVDQQKCDLFFSLLASGSDDKSGHSSIDILRKSLEDLSERRGFRKKYYMIAIVIKGWNAFISNKEIKILKFSPEIESFPKIDKLKAKSSQDREIEDNKKDLFSIDNRKSISVTVEFITPDIAQNMLNNKIFNRTISGPVVEKYSRDMKSGRWKLNGQAIKVSRSGQLLDGQHRLEAVKKAGRPFPAIVVRGILDETFSSLDIGRRKTLAESLRDHGEINTASLASALRWLWMHQNNCILSANISPTNGELLELLEENPDIRMSVRHALSTRDLMGSGISGALHFVFSKTNREKADTFFARLNDGILLEPPNPIYYLRERLLKNRKSHRIRMAEAERFALIVKAWNFFLQDRPMHQLSWRPRGPGGEAWPLPL